MNKQDTGSWIKSFANDSLLGSLMAVIFVTEYLALGNTAVKELASPQLLAEGASRSLVAVIIAVLLAAMFSRLKNHLDGPRITPVIIFAALLGQARHVEVIARHGGLGLLATGGAIVAIAGGCQIAIAYKQKARWITSWISAPLLGAILFAGALSTVIGSTANVLSCGSGGTWPALVIAATVVVVCQLVRVLAGVSRPSLAALGVPAGMLAGTAVYGLWLQFDASPGLCKSLGTSASTVSEIFSPRWPMPLMEIFGNLPALALMLIGGVLLGLFTMVDTLTTATALEAAECSGTHLDLNRELMVAGTANLVCGFLMLPPVAMSLSRSLPTMQAAKGARVAQLFHVFALTLILVYAMPLTAQIPVAVLAGCMVTIALDMINRDTRALFALALKSLSPVPAIGGAVFLFMTVIAVSLVSGKLYVGFAVGFLLSLLAYYRLPQMGQWQILRANGTLHITLSGALLFQQTPRFQQELRTQLRLEALPGTMVLNTEVLNRIDFQAANAIANLVIEARGLGWTVHGVGLEVDRSGGDILQTCLAPV